MTYQQIKLSLTKCENTIKAIQDGTYKNIKSIDIKETSKKLELMKESLTKQLNEMEMDPKKGMVSTDDERTAEKLANKGVNVSLTKEQEGVKFSKEETMAIAKDVGKAVAKALNDVGDEVAHMKAKDISEGSFEIYVQYKNESDDQFSFYISDDTLHLVDFSFDKELVDVGVKPSGEAIVHVDVLANELVKHFKSVSEGMSDQEYADAKEADRLEKHPEKDTIKKIQALIAAQQKSEATAEEEEEYHEKLDALTHKTFGKRKDELEEDINLHKIEVSIRDAKKAQDIMYDMYDRQFEQNGSNVYLFDDEQTAFDAMMDLTTRGIEVENIEDFDEEIHEGEGHHIYGRPVQVNKGEKSDGTDWTVTFTTDTSMAKKGKTVPLHAVLALIEPKPEVTKEEVEAQQDGDDLDIGHQDDEPDMLKQNVYDIATYAAKLYKILDRYDQMDGEVDFPHWWQKKVILARDYISAAQHYLEFEEKQPAIDALALEESVNESHAKLKKEYDALVGKMKQLAQHHKTAEGDAKDKIVAALKQHTARKRELESQIEKAVAGIGVDQELDELFGSKLNYDEIIGGIVKRFNELKKYVSKKEPDAMDDLQQVLRAFEIFDEKMAYGAHEELEEVNENKATCCGKCGRVHVKGTKCKRPFLTGKDHCRNN